MKLLFVTHHYLDGFGGGAYASRGMIHAFWTLSEEMTLLYPSAENSRSPVFPSGLRVRPVLNKKTRLAKLLDLLHGQLHRFGSVFRDEIAPGSFDTVVFDCCYPSFGLVDVAHQHG